MPRDVAVQDAPPVMSDHEKAVDYAKGKRGHGKEVHRGNGFAVIVQKRRPSPRRRRIPGSLSHPSQNRSLGDVKAQHLQLAVNSRSPPCGVLRDHAEDEIAQLLTRGFPSHTDTFARVPVPIQPEPGPVPAQDGVWLDKEQGSSPSRPQSPQSNPKQSVGRRKSWLGMVPRQDCELLPQGKIFQKEEAARPNRANERYKQEPQHARHGRFISQKTQQD